MTVSFEQVSNPPQGPRNFQFGGKRPPTLVENTLVDKENSNKMDVEDPTGDDDDLESLFEGSGADSDSDSESQSQSQRETNAEPEGESQFKNGLDSDSNCNNGIFAGIIVPYLNQDANDGNVAMGSNNPIETRTTHFGGKRPPTTMVQNKLVEMDDNSMPTNENDPSSLFKGTNDDRFAESDNVQITEDTTPQLEEFFSSDSCSDHQVETPETSNSSSSEEEAIAEIYNTARNKKERREKIYKCLHHKNEKPCGKLYCDKISVQEHIKAVHNKVDDFAKDVDYQYCMYGFDRTTKNPRSNHVTYVPPSDRPNNITKGGREKNLKCRYPNCNKSYIREKDWVRHNRECSCKPRVDYTEYHRHVQEKPTERLSLFQKYVRSASYDHKCGKCGLGFPTQNGVTFHTQLGTKCHSFESLQRAERARISREEKEKAEAYGKARDAEIAQNSQNDQNVQNSEEQQIANPQDIIEIDD